MTEKCSAAERNFKKGCIYMTQERKHIITENYKRITEKIEEAKLRRDKSITGEVTLLAATKTVDPEEILFAIHELGLAAVGENKVQEFLSKYDLLKGQVPLHILGHLQTNKVRQIVGKVDMIQSVDSLHLAQEIGKRSQAAGVVTDVLAEINIGREENKTGILPEEAQTFTDALEEIPGIRLRGLMTMAPVCSKKDEYLKYFCKTYEIYLDILRKKSHNRIESVLSMGMSDSFEAAIEAGATMVRIGSAIFGPRVYL